MTGARMVMSSDDIAVRVEGLSKCYHVYERPQDRLKQGLWRGRKQFYREFWALRDISFEVRKGETIGIIGRNGSGKSTLLQIIAGTLTPTSGTVQVTGRIAALLELGSGFNPEFTGRENVIMNGAILGLSQADIASRFDEIAAFADIGEFIDQPVKTYSSGMIVRLAFAVSVCVDPDTLIIDEALAVGDMAFQFKCMQRLDQLSRSGVTLLFVSHDIAAVKAFCRRAVYLEKGKSRASGSAGDMAELYLMDMRAEQKSALNEPPGIGPKPSLARDGGVAFGTLQGRVTHAAFTDTNGPQTLVASGEKIGITVGVEYDDTVRNPALTVIVYDYRMIEITGKYFYLARKDPMPGEANTSVVGISFPADFNNGNYFLTLRLEDRVSDTNLLPIDKQVGVLSFQVMRPPQTHFLGLVNVPIECRAIDEPGNPRSV